MSWQYGIVVAETCVSQNSSPERNMGVPAAAHENRAGIHHHFTAEGQHLRDHPYHLPRRSSSCCCRRNRRCCPSRWPRCASGCSCTGRSEVKPSWQVRKVDGRVAAPGDRVIEIRGTGHPRCAAIPAISGIPFQEAAHVVAVAAVPLRPSFPGGEGADLIESACVPGLCDQLDISQDRVESQASAEAAADSAECRSRCAPGWRRGRTGIRPPGNRSPSSAGSPESAPAPPGGCSSACCRTR